MSWKRTNRNDYKWYEIRCYCNEELPDVETMEEVRKICEQHYQECKKCRESEQKNISFTLFRYGKNKASD